MGSIVVSPGIWNDSLVAAIEYYKQMVLLHIRILQPQLRFMQDPRALPAAAPSSCTHLISASNAIIMMGKDRQQFENLQGSVITIQSNVYRPYIEKDYIQCLLKTVIELETRGFKGSAN